MVKETIPNDQLDLQLELINGCTDYRDCDEAWKWAQYYRVDYQLLPSILKDYLEDQSNNTRGSNNKREDDNWSDEDWTGAQASGTSSAYKTTSEEKIHKYPLNSPPVLVDDEVKFVQMIDYLEVSFNINNNKFYFSKISTIFSTKHLLHLTLNGNQRLVEIPMLLSFN